jgi:hypothetical protein
LVDVRPSSQGVDVAARINGISPDVGSRFCSSTPLAAAHNGCVQASSAAAEERYSRYRYEW